MAGHTAQIATNTAAIATLGTAITGMQTDIGTLFDLRREDRRDMKQGIAVGCGHRKCADAVESGRRKLALNGATFRGEYAVGGSLNFRLNTENPMALGVGFSYAGNKNNSARVGISGEF